MASYTHRKGSKKPHQVRYRDHTGASRSEQFTRKADAEARLREVQTAEETGRIDVLDAGTATLAEVGARFFALHKGEWRRNTAQGHAYVWNAAVDGSALAKMPIRTIRKSHVTEWRNDAMAAGIPASSVRRGLSLVSRTLDFAADDDLIAANPAARVKPPKVERNRATILTPHEVEAIRRALPEERDRVFVSVLALLGLRPHEARALHAEQFGGAELHLDRACAEDGTFQPLKAGHAMRDVPICAAVASDVAAFVGTRKRGLLFPNASGKPWTKTDYGNWRRRRFDKAAPSGVTPYDLRHSIASLWYREGTDRAVIAARLGHSVEELERTYAHPFKQLDALDRRTVDELVADARS